MIQMVNDKHKWLDNLNQIEQDLIACRYSDLTIRAPINVQKR